MRSAKVSILRTDTVKPAGAQAHEGAVYMTAWDQVFGVQHNQTVLLYNPPPTHGNWVDTMKGSLGQALAQFSPLAGRLRWVEGDPRRRLEILCNGEGAELTEAECDGEMSCFRDPAELEKVMALLPEVDYEGRPVEELPACMVQLTRFRCGGVAVGFSTLHMAADGKSAFHFLSEWARLARGEPMKEAPSLLYRTMLRERERPEIGRQLSDHIEYQSPPLMLGKEDAIEEWKKKTMKFALTMTKTQLDALKNAASSTASDIGVGINSRGFSRYEVVSAHIWRCLCKERGLMYEQETILSFPVNVRNHIHTIPLPRGAFGNMVIMMRAQSRVGELISNDLGFVCGKLREAINMVDEDYIWSNFDLLEKQDNLSLFMKDISVESKMPTKGKSYYGNPNLKVVSWLTLPIHDIDFGWGNYIDIIPVARDVDGSTILLPSPTIYDGSIVVLLCLQVVHVDEFKKHFYQDINQ